MYIDMDYFFAACEEQRHPELKGKPLAVGTAPASERTYGVVQTANYEARKFGIKSGMATAEAFSLCKDLAYLQSDEPYYESISVKVMDIVRSFGRPAEIISIDEAAVDISGLDDDAALEMAKKIKKRIKDDFGLTCTIGICEGKAFAKMASDKAKPDGLLLVKRQELSSFLAGEKLENLPGIGKKTYEKLLGLGIDSIKKLAEADPMMLIDHFGVAGKELYMLARGIDNSKIVEYYETLSIGREVTLKKPVESVDEIKGVLRKLADEVIGEVHKKGYLFKNVGAKVRYTDFTISARSEMLHNYTDSEEQMLGIAESLIRLLIKNRPARKVGIRVSRLIEVKGQKKLF